MFVTEFSKCAVLFQVPWEEACLIDWGHSWLYWKTGERINNMSFKQTRKSKIHLLGSRSNAVCFNPLLAQWVDILISFSNYSGKYMLPISLFFAGFSVLSTEIHIVLPGNVKFVLDLNNFALNSFWVRLWPISDGRTRTAPWCGVLCMMRK